MNSENMARVLQNMIEEAEENLLYLEKVHEGREHLTSRFAELKEAMDLEAELGGPLLSEDKPSPEPAPADEKALRALRAPRGDGSGGWTLDYGYLNLIAETMNQEFRVGMEEIEAVILAHEAPKEGA